MTDIVEVVIRIPKDIYNNAVNDLLCGNELLVFAVKDGIVLPENHGRLIDADKMKGELLYSHDIGAEIELNGTEEVINYIFNNALTVIEADKGVE